MRLSFGGKRFSRSGCFGGVRRLLVVLIVVLSPVQALSQNLTNPSETNTPGCAIGVNEDGKSVFRDAYGMADLEHGVPIQTDTIMEAGSVSKQFTAAAAVLLSLDCPTTFGNICRSFPNTIRLWKSEISSTIPTGSETGAILSTSKGGPGVPVFTTSRTSFQL